MLNTIEDLNNFLTAHAHPELEQLHDILREVFEVRKRTPPLAKTLHLADVSLLTLTSAALFLSQQGWAMVIFGGYMGARLVVQQMPFAQGVASEDQMQPLYCQSELFARRHPQHQHIDQTVRFLASMGLSCYHVKQLIQALRDFTPKAQEVAVEIETETRAPLSRDHLRL